MSNDSHLPRTGHSTVSTTGMMEKTKNAPRNRTKLPSTTSDTIERFQQVHFSSEDTMEHLALDIVPLQGTTRCIQVCTVPKPQVGGRQQHR